MMDFSEYLYYDETSPSFLRWKIDRYSGDGYKLKRMSAGDVAGTKLPNGYWVVRINHKGYYNHVIIPLLFGFPESETVDHIDRDRGNNNISNLRGISEKVNMRNKSPYSNSSMGVTGVTYRKITGKECELYTASWKDLSGKQYGKAFSFGKYGEEEAFRLACEYRIKMIEELNRQGAGYTENHGK